MWKIFLKLIITYFIDNLLQVHKFLSTGICTSYKAGFHWRYSSSPEVVNHLLEKPPCISQLDTVQHCEQIYMNSTIGKLVVCYVFLCSKRYIKYYLED
jgi:hypothetical protein